MLTANRRFAIVSVCVRLLQCRPECVLGSPTAPEGPGGRVGRNTINDCLDEECDVQKNVGASGRLALSQVLQSRYVEVGIQGTFVGSS